MCMTVGRWANVLTGRLVFASHFEVQSCFHAKRGGLHHCFETQVFPIERGRRWRPKGSLVNGLQNKTYSPHLFRDEVKWMTAIYIM